MLALGGGEADRFREVVGRDFLPFLKKGTVSVFAEDMAVRRQEYLEY